MAIGLALGMGHQATAQAVVSTGQSFLDAQLLVGERLPDGARIVGLSLAMSPGWKTYWRSPGEAGIPPSFDWSTSENVAGVEIAWPRPEIFQSFGFSTIGYGGEVVLPVKLIPEDPGAPIALHLDATLGVCRDICVLEQVSLGQSIPSDAVGTDAARIDGAYLLVPPLGEVAGLKHATCRIAGAGRDRDFSAEIAFGEPLEATTVLLEAGDTAWFHGVRTADQDDRILVSAGLSVLDEGSWINRSDVRMTVLADGFAADIQGCTAPAG